MCKKSIITILGPTACGKTAVATQLAARLTALAGTQEPAAEIISADSRQVFRGMDIGTGKDLSEYGKIPYHLIDIADPGTTYSVYHFQRDFHKAYAEICGRGRTPILCGGTGLYIESVLRGYNIVEVPTNKELRELHEGKNIEELKQLLSTYKTLHNTTDVDTARRAIRAIEIEEFYRTHNVDKQRATPVPGSTTIGLDIPRELRRQRITERLHRRLGEGMIAEVQRLLDNGVAAEAFINYGLEYRFITLYLTGQLTYDEMVRQLEIAIHQFAKRQMTYFRGMERRGVTIHWIDATRQADEIVDSILTLLIC